VQTIVGGSDVIIALINMRKIDEFYATAVEDEWKRLVKDTFHLLELNTTQKFLDKYLPPSGLILDAGGGPGRYTVELAKKGYQMVLMDITPELLEKARRNIKRFGVKENVREVATGSIIDLSKFEDESFDAVLCLGGPLSHVEGGKNRKRAVVELARVAKKGSPIFISVMGRLGVLLKMLKYWPEELVQTAHYENIWKKGDDDMWRGEYYCHFYLPEEITELIRNSGVEILETVGLEGLAHFKEDTQNVSKNFPQGWKNWLDSHDILCTHPSVFATSGHMLVVGRKK
jgi:SAM-dependent methyltransferase